jgi:hypothetical protein
MMFRRPSKSSSLRSHQGRDRRPILHVLDPGQRAQNFTNPITQSFPEPDVIISRAELDLRRAVQRMMMITGSTVNSLELLTALQLPSHTAAVFWVARLLLNQKLEADLYADNAIRRTNHDARLIYQAIAQIDLQPWYTTLVTPAPITALPEGLQFLPGHPVAQRYYRQHPLPSQSQVYLPVATYFADLFYERRQELLRLLINLGATRIQVENLADTIPGSPEVILAPGYSSPPAQFNPADYPWLLQEPQWQRLVNDRLAYQAPTLTLDLTLDVNGLLATQVAALKNLTAQLDSVKQVHEEAIEREHLQPQRVTVNFGTSP